MNSIKKRFSEKDGIAFIITLGLLGLLMITGVSFAVFMKTERAATANLMVLNESRELAKTGVSFAMNEISHSLYNDWYPSTNYGWYVSSPPTGGDIGSVDNVSDYYTFEDEVYYQNPILQRLIAPKTFENAKKFCQMDAIELSGDAFGGKIDTNQFYQGNFSYIIVNLSGTLDPNFAGGETNRTLAGTPGEFSLEDFPGIKDDDKFFKHRKDVMGWYETIGEIEDINKDEDEDYSDTIEFDKLRAVYPFSMFLQNTTNDSFVGADKIAAVYTTAAEYELNGLPDRSKLAILGDALQAAGVLEGLDTPRFSYGRFNNATMINYIDYLDNDNKPGGFARYEDIQDPTDARASYKSPYVDAFPMINEFNLKSTFSGRPQGTDDYKYDLQLEFNFEVWYPFISPTYEQSFPGDSAELEYSLKFSNLQKDILDLLPEQFNGNPIYTGTIGITNSVAVIKGSFWDLAPETFRAVGTVPITNMINSASKDYDVKIDLDLKIKSGGYIYDGFDGDYMFSFEIPLKLTPSSPVRQTIVNEFNEQATDPRLNYKKDYWTEGGTETIGTTNQVALDSMLLTENDNDPDMYIKGYAGHSGQLESVGEFGYIFTGNYWQTVRLFDTPSKSRHKIYDYLYLQQDNALTNNGYANPNTEFREVLTAALTNMPMVIDVAAGDGSWTETTPLQTYKLVDAILDTRKLIQYKGGIAPTNLCDSTFSSAIFAALGVDGGNGTELEKEAFYVSGMPAFNSRQQLFAIISRGNLSNSSRTCLAIVWRDPVADSDGYHPCFIREFIWVNGE